MVQHSSIDHTGITGVGGSLTVQDEGSPLSTAATTLNFTGAGVTASGTGATKTITIPSGGISSGTSNPGGPSNNDLFYRTDLDLFIFYDGTRWLTVTLYEHFLGQWNNRTTADSSNTAVWAADFDQYLVDFRGVMLTAASSSGTAYWQLDLYTPDGTTLGSAVATFNNQSATNNSYDRKKATIGALLGTGKDGFVLDLVKVTTPGAFYGGAMVTYRLVVP